MIPTYRTSVHALVAELTRPNEDLRPRRIGAIALAFRLSVVGAAGLAAAVLFLIG